MGRIEMTAKPVVSVVTGTYNRLDYLKPAIESVRRELDGMRAEIIVVDGGSTDKTIDWLVTQKDIISVIQHNRGDWLGRPIERRSWGYFMNLGFKIASGRYICMLSDDRLVIPSAIRNGVKLADSHLSAGEKLGAVAFYWRDWPHQRTYFVGLTFGSRLFVNHGLYVNDALRTIGYADEDHYAFYHADGDICLRLWQAGYSCIESEDSYVEHRSDANTVVRADNLARQQEDWAAYTGKWEHLGLPTRDWNEKTFTDTLNTADKYWAELQTSGLDRPH